MSVASPETPAAAGKRYFASVARWGPAEIVFWAALLAIFFVPDANLPLFGQIVIWGLFAMSLDLLLGYRGIPSIGHAAFFGVGAYAAGFLGKFGWTEPISGLVCRHDHRGDHRLGSRVASSTGSAASRC